MPMIRFLCNNPDCENEIIKYYAKVKKIPPFLDCGECSVGKLERTFDAPTTGSIQIIDNGNQAKEIKLRDVIVEREIEKKEMDED